MLVRKAEYPIACGSEDFFPLRVMVALVCVNASVKLDGKSALDTTEIDDEGSDGVLTSKLQPIQAPSP